MTDNILDFARQLATQSSMSSTQRYSLDIPEDTHWELVKLGANLKMHHEDYAEQVLIAHVEQQLDQQTKN